MRKTLTALLALSFFCSTGIQLKAQNLVANGDFEQVSKDQVISWKVNGSNQVPTASTEGNFVEGKFSLHIKHPEGKPAESKPIIVTSDNAKGIEAGQEYTISFFAKSAVPGQTLKVWFMTNSDQKPHYYKAKDVNLFDGWKKYEFTDRLPSEKEWNNRKLCIRFDVPFGEVFIDQVSLEKSNHTSEGLFFPSPNRKNLMNNPGMELGWLGWSMNPGHYSQDFEKPETPSSQDFKIKYEGNASLRIQPRAIVISQRYMIQPDQTYTLSFYARAEPSKGPNHKVSAFVINPIWKRADKTLKVGEDLGPDWKRYSISFKFPDESIAGRNSVYFRLDTWDNTVWIDAVQLEKGDKETPYECGLQAGILTDSKTGLFTRGKNETITVALTGTGGVPKPVNVELTARDVSSNVLWQKRLNVLPTKNELITQPITIENNKLGVMEINAEVKSGNESISLNRCRYCVVDGTPESARLNPLFGTENIIGGGTLWHEEMNELLANDAGSGFTRVFLGENHWTRDNADQLLEKAHQGLLRKKKSGKITMLLIDPLPGSKILPDNTYDEELSEEVVKSEIQNFAKHAANVASKLNDSVDYYQLVNEPNIWHARKGKKQGMKLVPPERYVEYVRAGSEAIRKVYPQAKIAANVNKIPLDYTEKLFEAGIAKYIDVFTFHPYQATPETPPLYDDILKLRRLIDRYAKGLPIINDETYFGLRNLIGWAFKEDVSDNFCDNEDDQAGRIAQAYLHNIAADRVPFCLFSVQMGLFRQGMSHPTYFFHGYGAYRFMSQTLYDITQSSSPELHPSLRTFLFERKDGTIWVTLNTKTYGVKGGIRNAAPDEAYDINGNAIDPQNVQVSYLPVYLKYHGTPQAVLSKLKQADIYGFDSPIRTSFEHEKGALNLKIENLSSKNIDGMVKFTRMPTGWKLPEPIQVKALPPQTEKKFSFETPEITLDWNKDYTIEYTSITGDSIISRSTRLPSIFATRQSITVDANLDDWKNVKLLELGENHLSPEFSNGKNPHKGPQDLSASAAISWDDSYIYFAIKVVDDKLVISGNENYWNDDSIQLFFDLQNNAGKAFDADDAVYCLSIDPGLKSPFAYLSKNPTGRFVGANNKETGIDGDVKVAFKKLNDGYVYEAAFPRDALPMLNFKEGSRFGFSILVNDNDGAGRKQGVTLGDHLTEPHDKPLLWRTIQLTR